MSAPSQFGKYVTRYDSHGNPFTVWERNKPDAGVRSIEDIVADMRRVRAEAIVIRERRDALDSEEEVLTQRLCEVDESAHQLDVELRRAIYG